VVTGEADAGSGVSTVPTQYRACQHDADCVAVDRVGCCHNGWKEAVAVSQKAAYAASFTCPTPRPMCPMFIVRDQRVAQCDFPTHLCAMIKPEEIHCGGFIRETHKCPDGYKCVLGKVPDAGGTCAPR
jgi:hypothetical protein